MAKIKVIESRIIPTIAKKKVAAYTRVSTGKDSMIHSLSAQISYYNEYISMHPNWELVEIYADEGISGTKEDRQGFQRMLQDSRDGKIDMILTKSITRFARNTVTLLNAIRELKLLNIDVYFEKENIHTLSSDGEFMITLLASYAQEEARSVSENQLWRVRKAFEQGIPTTCHHYGYRLINNKFEIYPPEAEVVKKIFELYLSGLGLVTITKMLVRDNAPTRFGGEWRAGEVYKMLKNEAYVGKLLLQKTYHSDFITKKTIINKGEKPMYEVIDAHEAIIDEVTFYSVQEEMKRRKSKKTKEHLSKTGSYPFSGKLICGICGKKYRRKNKNGIAVWICPVFNELGKEYCCSKQIREDILTNIIAKELSIETLDDIDLSKFYSAIIINNNQIVTLCYEDGTTKDIAWRQKSRSCSWTKEMREEASRKAKENRRQRKKNEEG